MSDNWDGYYDEEGHHIHSCGTKTQYQVFSGGSEYYCPECKTNGIYPKGVGGPRARLLTEGEDGIATLKAQIDQEIARRKEEELK